MKSEDQEEKDPPAEGRSGIAKWHRLSMSVVLRAIDAATGFLSRLRSRIDASPDGRDRADSGKGRTQPHSDVVAPEMTAPKKPRRLMYFFAFMLTLVVGAISGAAYCYHLQSKAITSNSATVQRLRDELAEMKKEEALNLKELASRQRTISSYDKGIVRYLKEIDDYKAEIEELRSQLSAARSTASTANSARTGSTSRDGRNSSRSSQTAAAPSQQTRPPRAGTCATDPANIAASLEKCVEEFNRK